MSVKPDTPGDWRTVKIQGRKCDIGPKATVEDLFEKVRHLIGSKALSVPGGTVARHKYTASRYGVVRKAAVGTDENGDWKTPDTKDDLVEYDLSDVEHGDELRVFSDPDWSEPVYPQASGESGKSTPVEGGA